jgi:hypothetical protein
VGPAVDFIPNTCHFYKISWEVFFYYFFICLLNLVLNRNLRFTRKNYEISSLKKKTSFLACVYTTKSVNLISVSFIISGVFYYFWPIERYASLFLSYFQHIY